MIKMLQRPDEASRSPDKSCWWIAECYIGDEHFEARGRLDAPNALARILVDAGVDDLPVAVLTAGVRGEARYRSLHAMAKLTFTEGVTTLLRARKFSPDSWTATAFTGVEGVDPEFPPLAAE